MSLILLYTGVVTGPVAGSLSVGEDNDLLSASSALSLSSSLASTEGDDVATSVGALTIIASAFITEGDDDGASTAILAIATSVAVTESDDAPSSSGAIDIVGTLAAIEEDDVSAVQGALGIAASLSATEEDDTLSASALIPIWYPRRGCDDGWAQYERRQIEWQEQLRGIIDRSWRIANGEIDPITFEPIPPPDHSAVIGELINQALTLDQARVEAFMVEQGRAQEEEAISILLLAA